MRPEPIRANPSKQHVEPEQLRALIGRVDELLNRTRRASRNIEERLQRALEICAKPDLMPRSPTNNHCEW